MTYGYDPAGRLTVVESVYGAKTLAESAYTLDNVGNRLSMTDQNGQTTRYTYDKDYELTNVHYPDGHREEYTYDPAGNRTSEKGTRYVYDPDNHMVQAGRDPYLYDENGNLVFGDNTLYLYDDENRLNNVLTLDGFKDIQYAYDGDGNRISRSVSSLLDLGSGIQKEINEEITHLLIPQTGNLPSPGQSKTGTLPAQRMNDQYNGLPGILQGTDIPDGLLGRGVLEDRGSVSANVYGSSQEYIYDFNTGLPRLVAEKDNSGNITDYLYDGRLYEGIIAQRSGGRFEESLSGTSVVGGVYGGAFDMGDAGSVTGSVYGPGAGSRFPGFGPGNPGGDSGGWWANPRGIPGGRIFYQQDGLGSVSAVTNIDGRELERYSYDAFGEPRIQGGHVPNPFMFTGEPYDQADGLLYLRARYYDPQIGRFLSQDSFFGKLTDPLSQNLYVYAENNPVLYVDPTGHGNTVGLLGDQSTPEGTGFYVVGAIIPSAISGGRQFEEQVLQILQEDYPDLGKNSLAVAGRIVDYAWGTLGWEAKYRNYISNSAQLRTFIQQFGSGFRLIVRQGARLSQPLVDSIEGAGGKIQVMVNGTLQSYEGSAAAQDTEAIIQGVASDIQAVGGSPAIQEGVEIIKDIIQSL